MAVRGAGAQIDAALSQWDGIVALPHRFGGREYRLGDREIGTSTAMPRWISHFRQK